jgi:hypothetical protein
MSRPTDRITLLAMSQINYKKLILFILELSDSQQQKDFPPGTMNRNIRDVLGHLYHWHLMMKSWYEIGMKGQKPDIPSKGYTWKTVPQLNHEIWEQYSKVPLQEIMSKLTESHTEMMELISQHTDAELFEKKKYPWTGTSSLGAYFIGATSSHYDWALKLITKSYKKMG